ncbi:MAG: CPBP family intramembrane metalloprotease, partial [Thermoplasmata archaeon]|nr:CPBP family intramembrane metalloprotease [Thermoplasmata archaeon]
FLSNAFYFALLVVGHEPSIPDFGDEIWMQVGIFTTASVWEEIESRVLLIGVPIMCIDFLFRRERVASPIKYILGGNMEIGIPESGAALFSSLIFGLAHVEWWDFWKFFPAAVTGLFLAYLFMRFGLYAAIILHFMLNFFDMPFVVIDRSSEFGLPIILLVFGLWGFVKYGKTLLGFVYHDLMKVPRPGPPRATTAGDGKTLR